MLPAAFLMVCGLAMVPLGLHSQVIPDQPRDTLDVLRERIRSLETEVDVLRGAIDSARLRYDSLASTLRLDLDQVRREVNQSLPALSRLQVQMAVSMEAYRAEVDDAEAERVRLANHLDSTRSEGVAEREVLTRRIERSRDALADSLTATAELIQSERQNRQDAESRNRFLLATLAGLLTVGIAVVWWSGRRRVSAVSERVLIDAAPDERIEEVRRELGEEVKREGQRLLEEQLKPLERISQELAKVGVGAGEQAEPDHDLPLLICNEVNRIEKNLAAMDASVRGHRQLTGCVRRVKDNLRIHRYDITELLGRNYDGGMHVEADFVEDQQLTSGQRVITRINRPEVRYEGKIIQNASVKVSVGF